jgi:hypothetical protein
MADATRLPNLSEIIFTQLSRPDAQDLRLAVAISKTATTLVFNYPLVKSNGSPITEAMLIGIRDQYSYVETVLIPAGKITGATATDVVRGVRLDGLDWTTGDSTLSVAHKSGDAVFCNISGIIGALIRASINGTIATGGTGFTIGTEPGAGGETVTVYRTTTAGVKQGFVRWYVTTGKVQYSNDGTTWVNFEDVTASDLVKASATDTTAGYLENKVTVSSGVGATVTKTTTGGGGDEKVNIDVALDITSFGVDDHHIYTPAFLTGGVGAEGLFNNWLAVLDGRFAITIDGTLRGISGIDFTGVTSMDDVASYIQTAIRAVTSGLETVVWSVNHFIVTSGNTTSSSAITVTSTIGGGGGTDISGAGASNWMDCDVGNGVVTNAAVNRAADVDEVVKLDSVTGELNTSLLEAEIREAKTFFGATYISGAEAETLSDGSNADLLHTHLTSKLMGVTRYLNVPNSTVETTVISFTLPGGSLGTNKFLKLSGNFRFSSPAAGARDHVFKLKYGGTTVVTITSAISANTTAYGRLDGSILGNGSVNVQEGFVSVHGYIQANISSYLESSGAAAENSNNDLTVTLTYQCSNNDSNFYMKHLVAELIS